MALPVRHLAMLSGLLLPSLLVLWPLASRAAVTIVSKDEVIVPAAEVIEDDLVVWAPYLRVDGVVKGDLVALVSQVEISGIVEGDLLTVAKSVHLSGAVNDDARIAAFALALGEGARVADDFWSFGYSLEAKPGSRVGGTLHAASRQALLAGQVAEDVLIRTGALELQGLTGGSVRAVVGGLEGVAHSSFVMDLDLEIPVVRDGVTVTETAAIGGDLDTRSQDPAAVAPGARITGRVKHEAWQSDTLPIGMTGPIADESFGTRGSATAERLVALLFLGLLLALAVPRFLGERGEQVRSEPVTLLGWGLGTVIAGFLASGLVAVAFLILMALGLSTSLGGLVWTAIVAGALTLLVLGGVFALALVYLSPVVASVGLGRAVLARLRPSLTEPINAARSAIFTIAVGALVFAALRAIPWIGPLVGIAGSLIGLGALSLWLRERLAP